MVSVVMASYNGERFITETIKAVLTQTHNDLELLICDDCSTDKTRSILDEWKNKDERVKVFYNKNNIGNDKCRKKLISNSKGEYIMFLDQDDLIEKDHIEKMLTKMNDDVSLVFCDYIKIDKDGNEINNKKHCNQKELYTKDLVKYNPIPVIGILLNKKMLEKTAYGQL